MERIENTTDSAMLGNVVKHCLEWLIYIFSIETKTENEEIKS